MKFLELKKSFKNGVKNFLQKVYSQNEIEYCKNKAFPAIHFAARFAAKESFLKSLGIGLGMGVKLQDIEVINNEKGSPTLKVHESIKARLDNPRHNMRSI